MTCVLIKLPNITNLSQRMGVFHRAPMTPWQQQMNCRGIRRTLLRSLREVTTTGNPNKRKPRRIHVSRWVMLVWTLFSDYEGGKNMAPTLTSSRENMGKQWADFQISFGLCEANSHDLGANVSHLWGLWCASLRNNDIRSETGWYTSLVIMSLKLKNNAYWIIKTTSLVKLRGGYTSNA